MTKPVARGDRSRLRVHTPSEVVVPTIQDGVMRVEVQKSSTVRVLERRGWVILPDPIPVPPPSVPESPTPVMSRQDELKGMNMKELRTTAKDLDIRGRSSMREDELIAAIMDAE